MMNGGLAFLKAGFALGTLLPLLALVCHAVRAVRGSWRSAGAGAKSVLVLSVLAGGCWLMTHPHEDRFTGLDNMAYGQMARVLDGGRGFFDDDRILADVPEPLRPSLLYRQACQTRPTRDLAFQLDARPGTATRPFFMPTLPLAAAGLPGATTACLMPLLAVLGWTLLMLTGFAAGGGPGLLTAIALALGTAWPAWFLRGFHADGAGSLLIAAVVMSAACQPLRTRTVRLCAGFTLGFAVAFHPTLLVIAAPVALVLILEQPRWRAAAPLAAGGLLGLLPFWGLTRWVCQPYGDWTRWTIVRRLLMSTPEHTALAAALAALCLVALAGLLAGSRPTGRACLRRLDAAARPWGWLVVALVPLAIVAWLPGPVGDTLRRGGRGVWSGIRLPFGLLMMAGVIASLHPSRPVRERLLLASLNWISLLFLFVQGSEIQVGIWSQRRFLPVILPWLAVGVAPLAARPGFRMRWPVAALLIVAGGANLARWPAAFLGVNEQGSAAWTKRVAQIIGEQRLVVFDHFPHSVPYAADFRHRVLGLGENAGEDWPAVADWLVSCAASNEVWLASSWSPTTLESELVLEPVLSVTGRFPIVNSHRFLPAAVGQREVHHHFLRAVPLARAARPPAQDKILDGSPIGLRGPWGTQLRDGTWTREGSGVIGPVAPGGETLCVEAEVKWTPPATNWTEQVLRITPPWGGLPLRCTVTSGVSRIAGTWTVPAHHGPAFTTGIYRFSVDRPFDPAVYGLQGFDADLGVWMRRVSIRPATR